MKLIFFFKTSKSPSVLLECANTLVQITNAPTAMTQAINIYIHLLNGNTDNNVKIIVLQKMIKLKQLHSKLMEGKILDILKILKNKSFDIRKLTIQLIQDLISEKNIGQFLEFVRKYLRSEKGETTHEVVEFKKILLEILKKFLLDFP